MLSRRNVRVKVMQLLYAQRQDTTQTASSTLRAYNNMIEQSYLTLIFDLYMLGRITAIAVDEQARRADKIRPTAEDLAFVPRIHTNSLTLALAAAPEIKEMVREHKLEELVDEEKLRGFYEAATSYDGYSTYSTADTVTTDEHLGALLKMHKALLANEAYNDYLDDRFGRWPEDQSLVIGAVKKILKSLPESAAFLSTYRPDKETRQDFGEHLLRYVLDHDKALQQHIEPVLQNWDVERVAVLDMIFIKMALSELLTFSQIPPKVTLNEYVELAKTYSTEKSKEFINGILDKLLHTLRGEGLIVKQGRGLIE